MITTLPTQTQRKQWKLATIKSTSHITRGPQVNWQHQFNQNHSVCLFPNNKKHILWNPIFYQNQNHDPGLQNASFALMGYLFLQDTAAGWAGNTPTRSAGCSPLGGFETNWHWSPCQAQLHQSTDVSLRVPVRLEGAWVIRAGLALDRDDAQYCVTLPVWESMQPTGLNVYVDHVEVTNF